MERRRIMRRVAAVCAAALMTAACAHRYSEDRNDWVGPRKADFDEDFAVCKKRMEDAPFRFRGDTRLLFLDCMEKRDWHLKGRS
jgi:hypothetical protein